jgi:hypothetical protein
MPKSSRHANEVLERFRRLQCRREVAAALIEIERRDRESAARRQAGKNEALRQAEAELARSRSQLPPPPTIEDVIAGHAPHTPSALTNLVAKLSPPSPPAEPAPAPAPEPPPPEPEWRSGEDWLERVGFSRFPRRPPSRPGAKPESIIAWCKRLSDEMPDRVSMKPGSIETYIHRHLNKDVLVKTLGER